MEDRMYEQPMEMYDTEPEVDEGPMLRKTSEHRPRRIDFLREYDINIRFLSVGCIVKVGCREIAFGNISEAMKELNEYVENPYKESLKWREIFDKED